MCFMKAPKISVPETPTPAPLPPDPSTAKQVESVQFGGQGQTTEGVTGVKGSATSGKSSLKIKKTTATPVSTGLNVGA